MLRGSQGGLCPAPLIHSQQPRPRKLSCHLHEDRLRALTNATIGREHRISALEDVNLLMGVLTPTQHATEKPLFHVKQDPF